jgi:hypothetical protein
MEENAFIAAFASNYTVKYKANPANRIETPDWL